MTARQLLSVPTTIALLGMLGLPSVSSTQAGSITTIGTFNFTNGACPAAGLIDVGGTLYGTTYDERANGRGTVFALSGVVSVPAPPTLVLALAAALTFAGGHAWSRL
jgi:uncharacterized repeat protein (TIGR03803 family)